MIRTSLLLLTLLIASVSYAQDDAISLFFNDYAESESFTKVSISSKMFQLFTHIEGNDEEEKEVLEAISGIKGLKIISTSDVADGKAMYRKALSKPGKAYEELMTVKDGEEDLSFFIRENGGKIAELLMITGGKNNFLVLSLVGNIDLNQVAKLSRSMDIGGMKQLEKIEEKPAK